jgi:uncharacterized protein (UPF0332 family)
MVKAIETMIDVLDGTLQLNGMRFLIEKAKGLNLNVRQQKILLHFLDVNRSSVEEIRKELGRALSDTYDSRQIGDCAIGFMITKDEAESRLEKARSFVTEVGLYLEEVIK